MKGLKQMYDANTQFIFDAVNAPVKKPSLRERLNKRVSFLTGTAAIAVGAVFGGAVGAGVGVGAYYLIQTPAPVVVNNAVGTATSNPAVINVLTGTFAATHWSRIDRTQSSSIGRALGPDSEPTMT